MMHHLLLRKCLLLSLLFVGIISSGWAQQRYYSKAVNFNLQQGTYQVVGKTGAYIYAYRSDKEGYYLDAFDDSMQLKATVALDFFPQKVQDVRIINYPDQMVVCYQAVQGSYLIAYMALLDNRALLQSRPRAIDSSQLGWFGSAESKLYSVLTSENKAQILLYGVSNADKKEMRLSLNLLDKDLQTVKKLKPKVAINNITPVEVRLMNSGDIHILATNKVGSKDLTSEAHLFVMGLSERTFKRKKINFEKPVLQIRGEADNYTNTVFYTGFYTDDKYGNVNGSFALYANQEDSVLIRYTPFVEKIKTGINPKQKRRALNDFVIQQTVLKADGGYVLIAENFYISTRTYYGGFSGYYSMYYSPYNAGSTIREYNYGDVAIISVSGDGEVEWVKAIRKQQYSQEDGGRFSSYGYLNAGGSLAFIYNDYTGSRNTLNLVVIDDAGQLDMAHLADNELPGIDWLPRYGKQIDLKEIVIPYYNRSSLGFVRVAFQ